VTEINAHDLEAIGDVADWLAEQADSLSAEQSVTMLAAARNAYAKLKTAIDMLEARALTTIEQPILVGRTAWSKKPEFKKRPHHALIQRTVVDMAVVPNHETGELPDPRTAAETATKMMAALYVSPSTVPKTGGVKDLGLTVDDVTVEEHTGYTLKRTDLE
jgi:hypothetical protein